MIEACKITFNRRSLRLKHYDYSQEGYYFITIVTQNREHFFGEIIESTMILNDAGRMIDTLWNEITLDFENIKLHAFVIMPNHIHGIIEICNNTVGVPLVGTLNIDLVGTHKINSKKIKTTSRAPIKGALTIGDIIGAFKSKTTNHYIKMVKKGMVSPFDKRLWQRNYYEHIVRDEGDYIRLSTYIKNNPQKWEEDMFAS